MNAILRAAVKLTVTVPVVTDSTANTVMLDELFSSPTDVPLTYNVPLLATPDEDELFLTPNARIIPPPGAVNETVAVTVLLFPSAKAVAPNPG